MNTHVPNTSEDCPLATASSVHDHPSATTRPEVPEFVCPRCHGVLGGAEDRFDCAACQAVYPIRDGVACFVEADEFYEERYAPGSFKFFPDERYPWNLALLYFGSMHYLWYIRKYFRRPGVVLDVASGGGTRYLTSRGPVAGLDLSLNSLRYLEAKQWYASTLRASAYEVPYPDGSVDSIAAKFIFEHIAPEQKPLLLREFARLLRPGGRLVMLFDCDCTNPLWLWAKRDPELFQKAFVENDGHYGLIRPSLALEMIAENGFRILSYRTANKTSLVHLPMLQWLQAYRDKSRLLRLVLPVAGAISRHRLLSFAYTFAVTCWDDLVGPLLPLDRARYLLVACEKVS